MLDFRRLEQNCVRDYRKYSDTVAISCAIYHLITKNPEVANFVGIEHNLQNSQGKKVTPDLVATYDMDSKGLLFEFKWSLPSREDYLEETIKDIKKYAVPCSNWRKSSDNVDFHDLVLVCHIDDVSRVVDSVKKLSEDPEYSFLAKEGFAVWTWTITPPKAGGRKEEFRLFPSYGKTRNQKIENRINQPSGLLFPEDVLTFLRFLFTFIREKPPVQYTMTILIQNVFPSFQQKPDREYYDIHVDMIYDRAKSFFPSWHKYDAETIQVKRKWIRDALDTMYDLGLCGKMLQKPDWWKIPIPTLRTRKSIQEVLCQKISKTQLKRLKAKRGKTPKARPIRPKGPIKEKPLPEFFKNQQ